MRNDPLRAAQPERVADHQIVSIEAGSRPALHRALMVEGIACAKKLVVYRAHDEARKELRGSAENVLFINQALKDGDGNNAMLFN